MNTLVRLNYDTDGTLSNDDYWHYGTQITGENAILCTGEMIDDIDDTNGPPCETKTVKRGGITCPNCLEHIKDIKAIKL